MSPVKITLVPSPMRVRIVFSVVGSRFWASSTTTIWRCSDAAAQERDRLERQLPRGGQLVDQRAGVAALRRSVRATRASWMADIHGSSFSSSPPGRNPDLGPPDRHERAVDARRS